jgi:hypothetical protein
MTRKKTKKLPSLGHQTKRTVRLVVSPLDTSSQRTLERVAMTEANRLAIKARAVDRNERRPATRAAPPSAAPVNLTDEWVEQAAAPLVDNRIADGLSVGYIDGKHWGIVHLGTAPRKRPIT